MNAKCRAVLSLPLIYVAFSGAVGAEAPVFFSIDTDTSIEAAGTALTPGIGIVSAIASHFVNKQGAKDAAALAASVGSDWAPQAFQAIACGEQSAQQGPCTARFLEDHSLKTLKKNIEDCNCGRIQLLRYFAFLRDEFYWARLVSSMVSIEESGSLRFDDSVATYYITRLPDSQVKLKGVPWSEGSPPLAEMEMRKSWPELKSMLLRFRSDQAAGVQFKALPKLKKSQDGWNFRCRGNDGCSRNYPISLGEDRAWILMESIQKRDALILVSIDRNQAAFATNSAPIEIP